MDVTVCVPIGPNHRGVAASALQSAAEQTVPVEVLHQLDLEGRGAGWARNRLLERVQTPYVVFLDADDTIEPEFVEACLGAMPQRGYVYTDWYEDQRRVAAPLKPWCGGTWHVVTTLLRTADVRAVGGFDERLPGLEDTDLYLKLVTRFICGEHVDRPLFRYSKLGYRSQRIRDTGEIHELKNMLAAKYGGYMACCGETILNTNPINQRGENDVLVMAMWRGNRQQRGFVTGRLYPRMSYPMRAYVDRRDVQKAPQHWALVMDEPVIANDVEIAPDVKRVFDLGAAAYGK